MTQESETPASETPRLTQTIQGILLVCVGMGCLTSMDFFAKILRESHATYTLVFYRALIGLMFLLIIALVTGQFKDAITLRHPKTHLGRSGCFCIGLMSFFYALETVNVATLTAITFATPLVATILAIPLLGERVHLHRWAAIITGFCGVLLIIQPGGDELSWPMLVVLGSTVFWALGIIITRRAPKDLNSQSIAVYFMIFLLAVTFIPTLWTWAPLAADDVPFIIGLGLSGALGQFVLVYAYRLAPISVATPFEYTAMIWAVIGDLILFATFPGLHIWIGTAVITASGLYIAYRERLQHRTVTTGHRRPLK